MADYPYIFTCANHWSASEASIKLWENVTKVTDYNDPPDSSGISPYPRPHENHPPDYSCIPADQWCKGDPGAPANAYWCEIPYGAGDWVSIYGCQGKDKSWPNGVYWNCFHDTETTFSMATHYKFGWKNVYAKKSWHGKPAYNSRDNGVTGDGAYPQGNPDEIQWCGACAVHYEDKVGDPTRYLTLTGVSHIHSLFHEYGIGDMEYDSSAWASSSVDRYSGVITNTASSSSNNPHGHNDAVYQTYADWALGMLTMGNNDISMLYNQWLSSLNQAMYQYGYPQTITGGGTAWSVGWSYESGTPGEDDYWSWELDISVDFQGGTWDYSEGGGGSYAGGREESHLSFGSTDMSWNWAGSGYTKFDGGSSTGQMTAHLSDPYTNDDVWTDLQYLLTQFPLNDDVKYPFRHDACTTSGPLVTFDEGKTVSVPFMADNITYGEGQTGEILGKPHPYNGASFWDARWENWDHCYSETAGKDIWYIKSFGRQCPFNSTQWTNLWDETFNMVHGSQVWSSYGAVQYASKWAETLVHRPAVNFARPCGKDRWTCGYYLSSSVEGGGSTVTGSDGTGDGPTLPTTTHYYKVPAYNCIKSRDGNVLHLEDRGSGGIPPSIYIQPHTTCSIKGTDIPGIYVVDAVDGYDVTLGHCVVSESMMPEEATYDDDYNSGYIAPLLYQYAPAICGKICITDVSPYMSGSLTCSKVTLAEDSWLVTGDLVQIKDVKGPTGVNRFWNVTVMSASVVLLQNSGAPTIPYTSSGYMKSAYAPEPKWNTDDSHWTFGFKAWETNQREIGEYWRLYNRNITMIGQNDCSQEWPYGNCGGCSVPPRPREAQESHGLSADVTNFTCSTYSGSYSACHPYVVSVGIKDGLYWKSASPDTKSFFNGDTFPQGKSFYIPKTLIDCRYGCVWASEIQQDMDDPFWVPPPCPCNPVIDEDTEEIKGYRCDCSWREDDGSCTPDQAGDQELGIPCIRYYPHRPMVEFLCKKDDFRIDGQTPPPLPDGAQIGCLSQAEVAAGKDGIVCNYLLPGQHGRMPWILWMSENACVCGEGRWANEYHKDKVNCIVYP